MRKFILIALVTILTTQTTFAQNRDYGERGHKRSFWWKLSTVALAAATMVDASSSWGHVEVNPVLRGSNGQFGYQGIAMKALITSGVIGAQYIMLRNHPKAEKYGTLTNFALGGVLGAAAVYNFRLHAAPNVSAAQSITPPSPR
jgi:hypothetical protein